MTEDFFREKADQIQDQMYDETRIKCGTIISFSKGISDCPRCIGLSIDEQIGLHIKQADEYEARKKLGLFFGAITIFLMIFCYLFLI